MTPARETLRLLRAAEPRMAWDEMYSDAGRLRIRAKWHVDPTYYVDVTFDESLTLTQESANALARTCANAIEVF